MRVETLKALIWKEWHEHKWRMAACCVAVGTAAVLSFRPASRSAEEMFAALMFIATLILPLFIAMALGVERNHGQLATLLVQPVRPIWVLAVKTALGWFTAVAPVLTVALLARLVMDDEAYESCHVPAVTLYGSLAALVTFTWMLAFGVRGADEVRVGVAAFSVLVLWVAAGIGASEWLERGSNALTLLFALNPPFFLTEVAMAGKRSHEVGWSLPVAAMIWAWGAWRFGLPDSGGRVRNEVEPRPRTSPRPLRAPSRPTVALLRKEWGLNRVWLTLGLLVFIALPGVILLVDFSTVDRITVPEFVDGMRVLMFLGVPLAAILIAVTGFSRELDAARFALLRAQPIPSTRWFVVKYASGLVVTLGVAVAPLLVMMVVAEMSVDQNFWYYLNGHVTAAQWTLPLLWVVLIYTTAVFVTVMVPQPIYAGILSVGVLFLFIALSFYESLWWLDLDEGMKSRHWDAPGRAAVTLLVYGLPVLAMAAGATALAWRIVRWMWWTESAPTEPRVTGSHGSPRPV